MRRERKYLGVLSAGILCAGAMLAGMVGCQQQPAPASSTTTVVEDTDHHDSHHWDDKEAAAYRRWEAEKSAQHQEYAARNPQDQKDYWNWRHSHPD
jgi:hypothetical protein